jgi:hypothetical protein
MNYGAQRIGASMVAEIAQKYRLKPTAAISENRLFCII